MREKVNVGSESQSSTLNKLWVCSRLRSSTSSTTTWTNSSSSLASAFAFSVFSVFLSSACGSYSCGGWPGWLCQTPLLNSFGSVKSIPCRPQLQFLLHNPARLKAPQVAPGTGPSRSGPAVIQRRVLWVKPCWLSFAMEGWKYGKRSLKWCKCWVKMQFSHLDIFT